MSCNNKKKNEAIPSLYCDSVVGKAEDDILSFPASAEGPLPPGQTGRGLGHGGHPELLHPEWNSSAATASNVFDDQGPREGGQGSGIT